MFELDPNRTPARLLALQRDQRGYPIPWFVNPEEPVDFRVLRPAAIAEAIQRNTCWICGVPLGVWKVYVLGPLGMLQKVTHEGACHRTCAEFAMKACPFIANPNMQRSPREFQQDTVKADVHHIGNPGMYALWVTRCAVENFSQQGNMLVLHLPAASEVIFYRERRLATAAEVRDTITRAALSLSNTVGPQHNERIAGLMRDAAQWVPAEVLP